MKEIFRRKNQQDLRASWMRQERRPRQQMGDRKKNRNRFDRVGKIMTIGMGKGLGSKRIDVRREGKKVIPSLLTD